MDADERDSARGHRRDRVPRRSVEVGRNLVSPGHVHELGIGDTFVAACRPEPRRDGNDDGRENQQWKQVLHVPSIGR